MVSLIGSGADFRAQRGPFRKKLQILVVLVVDVGFDAGDGHLVDVFLYLDVVAVFLSLRDVGDVILGPRLVAGHIQGQPVRGVDVHTDIPRLGQFGFQVRMLL